MKLVAEQPAIFTTIQGSGILAGMPMCFVRTFGCDYKCPWCDTPYSREGKYLDICVEDIAKKVLETQCDYAVITGGNPLLQNVELDKLLRCLSRNKVKVMLATQGSFSVDNLYSILARIEILALSPKLHDWRWNPLNAILYAATNYHRTIQLDIVCQNISDINTAFIYMAFIAKEYGDHINFCLVPEYSMGTEFIQVMREKVFLRIVLGHKPIPRITPQLHKLVYLVP